MKKSTLIQLSATLFIALFTACSTPSYFGKTYPATQNVDVYLESADVKKAYTTIGTSDVDQNFNSIEVMQQKMVEMGKAKGADGVIMQLTEEVAATQQSGTGTVNKKTKNNIYSSSATTVDIKKKKIKGTFIKYN